MALIDGGMEGIRTDMYSFGGGSLPAGQPFIFNSDLGDHPQTTPPPISSVPPTNGRILERRAKSKEAIRNNTLKVSIPAVSEKLTKPIKPLVSDSTKMILRRKLEQQQRAKMLGNRSVN